MLILTQLTNSFICNFFAAPKLTCQWNVIEFLDGFLRDFVTFLFVFRSLTCFYWQMSKVLSMLLTSITQIRPKIIFTGSAVRGVRHKREHRMRSSRRPTTDKRKISFQFLKKQIK